MYDNLDDDDEFKKDLRRGINNMETYLKPKLAR